MTSFMISQFQDRPLPKRWLKDSCVFCKIVQGTEPGYILYQNEDVIAILDTLPIRPGHVLIIPKAHHARLTELPVDLARAMGEAVTGVGDALTKGLDNPNLNVVCNQGYAQGVYHVHYHLVPAPVFEAADMQGKYAIPVDWTEAASSTTSKPIPPHTLLLMERENREEIDREDALVLLEKIKNKL